jgi:hypothetical protein
MHGAFDTAGENKGKPFRTFPLAGVFERNGAMLDSLAHVSAAIRFHFLEPKGWKFRVHPGSLTFSNRAYLHRSVKVFVDFGNILAGKSGTEIHANPVVVGIELSSEPLFLRTCIREWLAGRYPGHYLDPRRPQKQSLAILLNDKYWIAPHKNHFYDILFLPAGPCAFAPPPDLVLKFRARISHGIRKGRDDSF